MGAIELVIRLPGSIDSGVPGCGSKMAIVLFSSMPVSGEAKELHANTS